MMSFHMAVWAPPTAPSGASASPSIPPAVGQNDGATISHRPSRALTQHKPGFISGRATCATANAATITPTMMSFQSAAWIS
jgi:hypothetical protein